MKPKLLISILKDCRDETETFDLYFGGERRSTYVKLVRCR